MSARGYALHRVRLQLSSFPDTPRAEYIPPDGNGEQFIITVMQITVHTVRRGIELQIRDIVNQKTDGANTVEPDVTNDSGVIFIRYIGLGDIWA